MTGKCYCYSVVIVTRQSIHKRHNKIQNETVKHIYCYICSITHSCQEIENIMQTEIIQPLGEFLKLIFKNCETNKRKTQINCHDMSSLV